MYNTSNDELVVSQRSEFDDLKVKLLNYLNYWPHLLISIIISIVCGYLYLENTQVISKVQAKVIIEDSENSSMDGMFQFPGLMGSNRNLNNEIGILSSYFLNQQVVEDLELQVTLYRKGLFGYLEIGGRYPIVIDVDWSHPQLINGMFELEILANDRFSITPIDDNYTVFHPSQGDMSVDVDEVPAFSSVYTFGESINSQFFSFKISNLTLDKGQKLFFRFYGLASATYQYISNLQISLFEEESSILQIALNTPNTDKGQKYIDHLLGLYEKRELDRKNSASKNTIAFIDSQLRGITDSLRVIEDNLQIYRTENKIFDLSQEGSAVFVQLSELEQEKSTAELKDKFLNTLLDYISSDVGDEIISPSIYGIQDATLQGLVNIINELQSEKVRLSAYFSKDTPAMKEISNKISVAKRTLRENVESARRQNASVIENITRLIDERETEINALPETERRLLGIQRNFTLNENIYVFLQEKRAEAEIALASNSPSNVVLESALLVPGVLSPIPGRIYGLFVSVIFTLFIASIEIKTLTDTKIKKKVDIQRVLNFPIIGMIGRHTNKDSIAVLSDPKSTISESFRNVRSDLSYVIKQNDSVALLVSSTISGEGKTFVAANLAAVYALTGKKVLVLGMDLRKPRLAKYFGMKNDVGLSTYLTKPGSWQDMIRKTEHEHMDVFLSGPVPPNPAELILSARFQQLITELKRNYDLLVFDCPPIGIVSETKELLKFSDINLFILRQKYSSRDSLVFLNEIQRLNNVNNMYAIFNDVHLKGGYGYSYEYGYGYGYGYGDAYGYHDKG